MATKFLLNGEVLPDFEPLLTPAEVGALFGVVPRTVTHWAQQGRIGSIRTPGGTRRYRESEVRALLDATREGGPAA